MQTDMHYYGTYALARSAGIRKEICSIMATAAQFVDDNAASRHIEMLDGGRIDAEASAHHVAQVHNILPSDQRQVWVPFHFLPGNQGDSFSERLVCRKNSAIAQEMVRHHLGLCQQAIGPYLIGITAHVYADTFSHYGFSGVSSRRNRVVNDSIQFNTDLDPDLMDYLKKKEAGFLSRFAQEIGAMANMKSWLAETLSGALGHGAVATYPDRPYLRWSFEYEYPSTRRVERDNPADFVDACEALHRMFRKYATKSKTHDAGDGVAFRQIRAQIEDIIDFPGNKQQRIAKWRSAARNKKLGPKAFAIPDYDPEIWLRSAAKLNTAEDSATALENDLYRFYRAASIHRQYVLRDLLPRHDLVVA